MRPPLLFLLLAASVAAAGAQTTSKPANTAARTTAARMGTHSTTASKLPANIPVVHGVIHNAFTLRYQDYKIGTGALAEPNKVYHVLYTGYIASTGQIFDSSQQHRTPVMKDGKPVMDAEGNPELNPPQPLIFPQGFGRLIPGFDQGFAGMHIGGKRRIFIPWQLGYGTRDIPARGAFPGIPPKSDLIFDVELVDVTDMPQMPRRPMLPPHPPTPPAHPGEPAKPATPGAPATPPPTNAPATPPTATAPANPGAPTTTTPQPK